jgi:hypothetical protein
MRREEPVAGGPEDADVLLLVREATYKRRLADAGLAADDHQPAAA